MKYFVKVGIVAVVMVAIVGILSVADSQKVKAGWQDYNIKTASLSGNNNLSPNVPETYIPSDPAQYKTMTTWSWTPDRPVKIVGAKAQVAVEFWHDVVNHGEVTGLSNRLWNSVIEVNFSPDVNSPWLQDPFLVSTQASGQAIGGQIVGQVYNSEYTWFPVGYGIDVGGDSPIKTVYMHLSPACYTLQNTGESFEKGNLMVTWAGAKIFYVDR